MFNLPFPVGAKVIISETVVVHIDDRLELVSERHPLCGLHDTFKHAELDTLAKVETSLRDTAQPSFASR